MLVTTKAIVVWFVILLAAFANGALRELILVPALGSMTAQLASGLLLSVAVVALAVLSAPWLGSMNPTHGLLIGLLWVCLTLAFEFGFGLLVQRKSFATMLAAYTFKDGNLWPVVVVVTGLAPLVAAHIRGLV